MRLLNNRNIVMPHFIKFVVRLPDLQDYAKFSFNPFFDTSSILYLSQFYSEDYSYCEIISAIYKSKY